MKLISSKSTRNTPSSSKGSASARNSAPTSKPAPAKRSTPAPKPSPKKSGKRGGAAFVITLLGILVIAGGLFVYSGFKAQNSNEIYPNISAYGLKIDRKSVV